MVLEQNTAWWNGVGIEMEDDNVGRPFEIVEARVPHESGLVAVVKMRKFTDGADPKLVIDAAVWASDIN